MKNSTKDFLLPWPGFRKTSVACCEVARWVAMGAVWFPIKVEMIYGK